jgi:hypothetical protein
MPIVQVANSVIQVTQLTLSLTVELLNRRIIKITLGDTRLIDSWFDGYFHPFSLTR